MSDANESVFNWKVPVFVLIGLGIIYGLYFMFGVKTAFDSANTHKASKQFLSACIGVKEGLGKPKECLNFYNEVTPQILSGAHRVEFLGLVKADSFRDLHVGLQNLLDEANGKSGLADWPKLKTLQEIYGNQKPQ